MKKLHSKIKSFNFKKLNYKHYLLEFFGDDLTKRNERAEMLKSLCIITDKTPDDFIRMYQKDVVLNLFEQLEELEKGFVVDSKKPGIDDTPTLDIRLVFFDYKLRNNELLYKSSLLQKITKLVRFR